jgi:acetylornithine deacetylase
MHQLNELYGQAINLLKKLIAIPSFSREEHNAADAVVAFFQAYSIPVTRKHNNVWVHNKYYDSAKASILLCSHIDTVKPDKDYTRDPFLPQEEEGKLFGLGANDAGAGMVSLIAAFLYFYEQQDLKYNIILAAVAEEEISGMHGLEAVLPDFTHIAFALVGEPTQMQMAVAEKGLLVLDCVAHGKSAHAAREEGDNTIYKAMKDIAWFSSFTFPKVSELLGPVKMSVTIINSGTRHNVVPAECSFTVDIRLNEHYTHEEVLEIVKQHTQSRITARSMRLKSSSIDSKHPVVQAGEAIGLTAFGSSTMSDKAIMPFPALKIGPGDSARSHTADEFVFTNEIKEGISIYIQLLKAVL